MAGAACGAALASSLRLDALVPVLSLLPKAAGAQTVLLKVRIQQLPTTVRPDTFYKSVSQDFCLFLSLCVFFFLFFYILSAQNKTVSMSNVLCREMGCRGTGIPAPDVTWRGSTGGG